MLRIDRSYLSYGRYLMIKCTKKQLVDFLSNIPNNNGLLKKSDLNKISKNQMIQIIEKYPSLLENFKKYIASCEPSNRNDELSTDIKDNEMLINENDSLMYEEQFNTLIEDLKSCPDGLLEILKFNEFIDSLPYGAIFHEKLIEWYDMIPDEAMGQKIKLLNYITNQSLYFEGK